MRNHGAWKKCPLPPARIINATATTGPRFYQNEACEATFVHRGDGGLLAGTGEVLNPENYAFWLYNSASRVTGHETRRGRSLTVIQGTHDAYLARELGAATFTMWVDDTTGALVQLRGTDAAGRVVFGLDTTAVAFDRSLKLADFTN